MRKPTMAQLAIRDEIRAYYFENAQETRMRLQRELAALRNRQARSRDPKEKTFIETKIASLRRVYMRGHR